MIKFMADRITVQERISDNSYKVIIYTGEYMQVEMVKLMALPKDINLKITVEKDGE